MDEKKRQMITEIVRNMEKMDGMSITLVKNAADVLMIKQMMENPVNTMESSTSGSTYK